MAFLTRLFKREAPDPLAEREAAYRQGARDARRHPLSEFTDPDAQPAFVTELRARCRQHVAEVDQELVATHAALMREAGAAREAVLRELSRAVPNGHVVADEGEFITPAQARQRRAEHAVLRSNARISQLARDWENALHERDHRVRAAEADVDALVAAYRSGVLSTHPRREDIPPLWKGEVGATSRPALASAGREELGRLLDDVEHRVEVWRAEARPALPTAEHPALPTADRPALLPGDDEPEPHATPPDAAREATPPSAPHPWPDDSAPPDGDAPPNGSAPPGGPDLRPTDEATPIPRPLRADDTDPSGGPVGDVDGTGDGRAGGRGEGATDRWGADGHGADRPEAGSGEVGGGEGER